MAAFLIDLYLENEQYLHDHFNYQFKCEVFTPKRNDLKVDYNLCGCVADERD